MKKSKFLLLGSVASLASIPFVATKCGETKEEEKKKTWKTHRTKIQVEIKTLEEK
nr:variable surface lipoprotein [Mycoplasmopsis bovis]